jgi:hypothetical protein
MHPLNINSLNIPSNYLDFKSNAKLKRQSIVEQLREFLKQVNHTLSIINLNYASSSYINNQ